MKFYKIKTLFFLSLVFATLFSCDEDDRLEDVRNKKPLVTVNKTIVTATEGEEITFTLTVDNALSNDMDFKLELIGGTGSFRDYVTSGIETTIDEGGYGLGYIGHKLVFPAFQKTATFTITPVIDLDVEGSETFQIRLASSGNGLGLVADNSSVINLTVNDLVSDDLGITLDWTQTYADQFGTLQLGTYTGADGKQHDYADYDFDFYVFDSVFNEVSGSAAATGSAPESAIIMGSSLPDGDYSIYADKFDNAPSNPSEVLLLPMTLTVSKLGTWSKVIPVTHYSSNSTVSAPNGLDGGEFLVANFSKAGSIYTLKDPDTDAVLAQGRLAQARAAIKILKKNKK